MAQSIIEDQPELSQYLQLLHQLHSSEPQMPYQHGNKRSGRNDEAKQTIHVLDTIAVALTTGKPGEVFAVGLDKTGGLKLVLAKNEPHTDEDDQAIRRLLTILTEPETEDAIEVLPFLFARCQQNIKKRVRKMLEALDAFSSDFEEASKTYEPSRSFREEFPHFEPYRIVRDLGDEEIPFPQMMRDLWLDILAQTQTFLGLTEEDDDPSQSQSFATLAVTVSILEKSPFLRSLCNPDDPCKHADRKSRAERLTHRLAKVCQYYQGIHKLVKYTKRIPTHTISHCWVSPITGTGETTVHLDDYLSVMSHAFYPRALPDDAAVRVQKSFSELEENWRTNRSIQTRVHPELRILLHFDDSPNSPSRKYEWQPIGCSKRTCLCCTLWINAYNETTSARRWLTSGSYGKSYVAWAFPGHLHASGPTAVARRMGDGAVRRGVKSRLADSLDLLFPREGRVSDEDW